MASDEAIKIYEDNQGSIALAKNPQFHKRTKHIDIRYHFVREKVEDGQVVLQYVSTTDMLADMMTKAITAVQFQVLRSKLGIQAFLKQWELCDGCALGKQTRVGYMKSSPNRAKQVLEVVHSDVCGPMQTPTFGGKRYFVTFIDDKSHFCVVYLLRNKSEVAAKFAEFVAFAETQTGKRVQTLRSDNGGEYTSGAMAKFCADRGIVQKFTPPYTPQLNGVAERMNRTLVECARCMLEHAGLPKTYWGEAVMTATFLRNRCPTRAISHDKSPHQVWTGKKPLLANLKVFGCHAYVHEAKAKRTKFDARSVRCRFLGYSEHEKAYRFEELESSRVLVSRDAQFMEDVFDSWKRDYHQREVVVIQDEETTDQDSSQSDEDDNEEEEEEEAARDEDFGPGNKRHPRTQSLEEVTEVPSAKRYASQSRHQTLDEMSAAAQESQDFEAAYVVDSVGEMPTTFKSAMESSDAVKWKEACDSEWTRCAVWLKVFLCELGEMASDEAIKIYEDNQGSIALAKNPQFHKRTKHIDIRYHFVREKVEDGQVVLQYVSTTDMLADMMTKAITAVQFQVLRSKLGIQGAIAVESSGSVVKKAPRAAAVYRDVCGPMQTPTFGGKRYFVTFIDDKSHFCVVYLLRNKSEVAAKFAEFVAFAETQTGKRVKTLRSDNGGEYTSGAMAKFCADRGIVQKFTPPYTPQLNGVAERMNRTLVE
uniref:Integrase catalytic domain-containing protein n=1 Tax=Phytophthora ramorum TaxID=164328 RepID=H3H8Y7_PHYRM